MLREDTYRHKGLRKRMVETIKQKGIKNPAILEAITRIPRHNFTDYESALDHLIYEDTPRPINCNQTISQPSTVAFQTELLDIKQGDKILEIGTGSGYQASVLLELKAKVFTIERHRELFINAKATLEQMGYRPRCFFGDGYMGLPNHAPFDKIIITAGAPYIPEELINQLKPNGIMVIPVGIEKQKMIKMIKNEDNTITTTEHGDFAFVPMLKGKE